MADNLTEIANVSRGNSAGLETASHTATDQLTSMATVVEQSRALTALAEELQSTLDRFHTARSAIESTPEGAGEGAA
jgi:hypothetical protein